MLIPKHKVNKINLKLETINKLMIIKWSLMKSTRNVKS
jgi:hypothetical protein